MVKKIHFPREVLPIAFTAGNFVNMLLSFIVIFVVIIISGIGINLRALIYLPLVMIIEFMLALGVTLLTAGLTVYFRDLQHIFSVISLAWMYMTPVLYPVDSIPEQFRGLFYLNPMTPIIVAYRDILYYKRVPEWELLSSSAMLSLIVMLIGFIGFHYLKRHFAEEL